MKSIIFIGPHPDDIELGCGGTVARICAEEQYRVLCLFLTKGGHIASPDLRTIESTNACVALGVPKENVLFCDLTDRQIPEGVGVIDPVENIMRTAGVDITRNPEEVHEDVYAVFIPSGHDNHQDHRAAFTSLRTAFRHAPRIYAYETPSSTADFCPSSFIDLTDIHLVHHPPYIDG